jgi:hypothetical protein
MRTLGIGLVSFSLLSYMFLFMHATGFDDRAGIFAVAVTVPFIVLLIMIAARAGFTAAATLVAVVALLAVVPFLSLHDTLFVVGVALVASLAPLVGLAMIAFAARRTSRT